MELSSDKFSQGMNTSQYVDCIKVNKQPFLDIYSTTEVPEAVQSFFDTPGQKINLAVFTSDWCGDAMSTTPAILKMADNTDNIDLEIFNRDDELELANSFLPENRAGTTPIFVILDTDMREISRFIETASSLVPNTSENCRSQAVWYRSAANPDNTKHATTPINTPTLPCPLAGTGLRVVGFVALLFLVIAISVYAKQR